MSRWAILHSPLFVSVYPKNAAGRSAESYIIKTGNEENDEKR